MKSMLLVPLVFIGCREASSAERSSGATVSGRAAFADSDLDRDNAHRQVNLPAGQSGTLHVVVRGTGTIDAPDCNDAQTGQFVAYYDGQLTVNSDGSFSTPVYPNSPPVFTAGGCAVRGIESAQVAAVDFHATLQATNDGCRDLCDGRGRAFGESQCANSADHADCRVPVATSAAQQCAQTCLSSAAGIFGHGYLEGAPIAGGDLMSGAIGDMKANITFDQIVDANNKSL